MTWHTIKRNPADILFSKYIRAKAKGKCERCGKVCEIDGERIGQLECSHYFSRRINATRYDPENCYALCSGCHKRMGGHQRDGKGEYDLWVKSKLGTRYNLLCLRAETYHKKDQKTDLLYVKALWNDIK